MKMEAKYKLLFSQGKRTNKVAKKIQIKKKLLKAYYT